MCPKCGKEQFYSCKSVLILAIKKNTVCLECLIDKKRKFPKMEVYKKNCSDCGKKQIYSCRKSYKLSVKKGWKCKSCSSTKNIKSIDRSIFKTEEYRKRQSEMMLKVRRTDSFGEAFKEKCRVNKLNQIKKQGISKTYNEGACKFIDEINNKFGYNLQHALNGGEVIVSGFSLDGYDKNKNIVFEYDEPKHNKRCQVEKDKIRQEIILEKLNPIMFLRFNEEYKTLIDVVSGKEILT